VSFATCINSKLFNIASNEPAGLSVAAIGGAVGGVVVFLLLVVVGIVVLLVRQLRRTHDYSVKMSEVNDEPSTAAIIIPNAVYTAMNRDIKDDQVVLPHTHDGVKMESNPSYGTTSDVIIQPNPSYGVARIGKTIILWSLMSILSNTIFTKGIVLSKWSLIHHMGPHQMSSSSLTHHMVSQEQVKQ